MDVIQSQFLIPDFVVGSYGQIKRKKMTFHGHKLLEMLLIQVWFFSCKNLSL